MLKIILIILGILGIPTLYVLFSDPKPHNWRELGRYSTLFKSSLKPDRYSAEKEVFQTLKDAGIEYGIIETANFVEVDLRKALPSIYLRPHAQHALVVRRRDKGNIEQKAGYYDMASQVTAILRVRIDRVSNWLGEGTLLTQGNLFPSPSIDQGYNNLLMNSEIFKDPFDIKKYFWVLNMLLLEPNLINETLHTFTLLVYRVIYYIWNINKFELWYIHFINFLYFRTFKITLEEGNGRK